MPTSIVRTSRECLAAPRADCARRSSEERLENCVPFGRLILLIITDLQILRISYNNVITSFVYLSMIKTLTTVGNSKAVIIPAEMIKKYKLEKVVIEETEDGILIRSAVQDTDFQKAVEKLRKYKTTLYKRIESQANEPETIAYYSKSANNLSDIDLNILED